MVNITPEASIFGIFQNLNYRSWYALGEFVDNAIAAWEGWGKGSLASQRPPCVKVQIEISTSGAEPYIEIRDNATGIKLEDFGRAFKVASIPPDRSGLNEFGMGMKTAGFWFANNWTVRTSFIGEPVARTMTFNLEKILTEKISQIEPDLSPSSAEGHFTTVRLMSLNQFPKGQTIGKIKRHLTSMYREFIRDGSLVLEYNGEVLTFEEPQVLSASQVGVQDSPKVEWKKKLNFSLDNGRTITGWAGIRETGNTSLAGFALLRKKRVILGSADEPYRPAEIFGASNSYRFQRIFGEIHFDSTMGVTHTKDGFKWEEGEEEDFIEKLKLELVEGQLNLLQQAEKYRSRELRVDLKSVESALDTVRETIEKYIPNSLTLVTPVAGHVDVSVPDTIDHLNSANDDAKSISLKIKTQTHGVWGVEISGISDEAVTNFFKVGATNSRQKDDGKTETHLEVEVNLAHPFARKYLGPNLENSEFLFAFTSCLAISLALGKSVGARSNYIVDYLNDILRFGGGV